MWLWSLGCIGRMFLVILLQTLSPSGLAEMVWSKSSVNVGEAKQRRVRKKGGRKRDAVSGRRTLDGGGPTSYMLSVLLHPLPVRLSGVGESSVLLGRRAEPTL